MVGISGIQIGKHRHPKAGDISVLVLFLLNNFIVCTCMDFLPCECACEIPVLFLVLLQNCIVCNRAVFLQSVSSYGVPTPIAAFVVVK